MPESTNCPAVFIDSLTRKSPSFTSSLSASALLMGPWNQISFWSCDRWSFSTGRLLKPRVNGSVTNGCIWNESRTTPHTNNTYAYRRHPGALPRCRWRNRDEDRVPICPSSSRWGSGFAREGGWWMVAQMWVVAAPGAGPHLEELYRADRCNSLYPRRLLTKSSDGPSTRHSCKNATMFPIGFTVILMLMLKANQSHVTQIYVPCFHILHKFTKRNTTRLTSSLLCCCWTAGNVVQRLVLLLISHLWPNRHRILVRSRLVNRWLLSRCTLQSPMCPTQ